MMMTKKKKKKKSQIKKSEKYAKNGKNGRMYAYLSNLDRQRTQENAFHTMLYAFNSLSTCLNHKNNG